MTSSTQPTLYKVPTSFAYRMANNILLQRYFNVAVPMTPSLSGQFHLVTGGHNGIGQGISRGLVARGATVVICGRNDALGKAAVDELNQVRAGAAIYLSLDLSDLKDIKPFIDKLVAAKVKPFAAASFNAGVWPTKHQTSAQNFELAYATNVLGHHALFHALHNAKLLAPNARVSFTTGDIYMNCTGDPTEDYVATEAEAAQQYYDRSKLGNLWQAFQLQKKFDQYTIVAVHPGVIASSLHTKLSGIALYIATTLLLTVDEGAHASLFVATQPLQNIVKGGYLHNTCGFCELPATDRAVDVKKAEAFVARLDQLIKPFL